MLPRLFPDRSIRHKVCTYHFTTLLSIVSHYLNDGYLRYFTCDPGYGLFAQAAKIQMIESPVSSSTSLSSFETPRKAEESNGDGVMKPDFVNRTPASTPGVKSSLSGLLSKVCPAAICIVPSAVS